MAGLSNAAAATTITATARLSRELTWRFDRQQLAAGKLAWERADVLPYPAWLKRLWRDLADALPQAPLLLNEAQLAAAWEGIIRADIARRAHSTEPLWNTHASAKISVDAWRILNDWEIDLDECGQIAPAGSPLLGTLGAAIRGIVCRARLAGRPSSGEPDNRRCRRRPVSRAGRADDRAAQICRLRPDAAESTVATRRLAPHRGGNRGRPRRRIRQPQGRISRVRG